MPGMLMTLFRQAFSIWPAQRLRYVQLQMKTMSAPLQLWASSSAADHHV